MDAPIYCNKCGSPNAPMGVYCSRCGAPLNPAAAPAPGSATAAAPAAAAAAPYAPVATAGVHYGGFWIRVVAAIIDAIIVRIPVHVFGTMLGLSGLAAAGMGLGGFGHGVAALPLIIFGGGVLALFVIAGSWLYEAFMLSSPYQATLGKMIFGMKVTDLYGNRISFARATGRHFAKYLSGPFTLFIGFMLVGFTERKQGLHDMIAGTLVKRS